MDVQMERAYEFEQTDRACRHYTKIINKHENFRLRFTLPFTYPQIKKPKNLLDLILHPGLQEK